MAVESSWLFVRVVTASGIAGKSKSNLAVQREEGGVDLLYSNSAMAAHRIPFPRDLTRS